MNESFEDFANENKCWHWNKGKIDCAISSSPRALACLLYPRLIMPNSELESQSHVSCGSAANRSWSEPFSFELQYVTGARCFLLLENSKAKASKEQRTKAGFNPQRLRGNFKYNRGGLLGAAGNRMRLALVSARSPPSFGSAEGRVHRQSRINNSGDKGYRGPSCDVQLLWQIKHHSESAAVTSLHTSNAQPLRFNKATDLSSHKCYRSVTFFSPATPWRRGDQQAAAVGVDVQNPMQTRITRVRSERANAPGAASWWLNLSFCQGPGYIDWH